MLTWIEIDGFKSFRNFKAPLASFQVIIGANGVGKSNLFDALRLLANLAETDLRTAFLKVRGNAGELFTVLPTDEHVATMRFAVELFVDRHIRDEWGSEAELKFTRMRYELEIARRPDAQGLERPYVTYESLEPINRGEDDWLSQLGKHRDRWLPTLRGGRGTPFISTEDERRDVATLYLHQDGRSGRKATVAEKAERTVLSGVLNTEFPHAFAAREEMRAWKRLQLNPVILRDPSPLVNPQHLKSDGEFLAGTLARLDAEDEIILKEISADLAYLVPEIKAVVVEPDRPQNRYLIKAYTRDGREFSSSVLSDGTLRLLALLTLKYDPQHRGVLCFEEPENGVHPRRLKQMVEEILRPLATDFESDDDHIWPLRQLLVNTHSPVLAQALDEENLARELLFATMVTQTAPLGTTRVTQMYPVKPSTQMRLNLEISSEVADYTLGQVMTYLESANPSEIIAQLKGN
ncbi:MAG: AAA family ATPase [Anaerolineales bacterium]